MKAKRMLRGIPTTLIIASVSLGKFKSFVRYTCVMLLAIDPPALVKKLKMNQIWRFLLCMTSQKMLSVCLRSGSISCSSSSSESLSISNVIFLLDFLRGESFDFFLFPLLRGDFGPF